MLRLHPDQSNVEALEMGSRQYFLKCPMILPYGVNIENYSSSIRLILEVRMAVGLVQLLGRN